MSPRSHRGNFLPQPKQCKSRRASAGPSPSRAGRPPRQRRPPPWRRRTRGSGVARAPPQHRAAREWHWSFLPKLRAGASPRRVFVRLVFASFRHSGASAVHRRGPSAPLPQDPRASAVSAGSGPGAAALGHFVSHSWRGVGAGTRTRLTRARIGLVTGRFLFGWARCLVVPPSHPQEQVGHVGVPICGLPRLCGDVSPYRLDGPPPSDFLGGGACENAAPCPSSKHRAPAREEHRADGRSTGPTLGAARC